MTFLWPKWHKKMAPKYIFYPKTDIILVQMGYIPCGLNIHVLQTPRKPYLVHFWFCESQKMEKSLFRWKHGLWQEIVIFCTSSNAYHYLTVDFYHQHWLRKLNKCKKNLTPSLCNSVHEIFLAKMTFKKIKYGPKIHFLSKKDLILVQMWS